MKRVSMENGQVVNGDTRCSECKQALLRDWSYCPHCGMEIA